MNLTFSQAAKGVNKDITLNVVDTCPKCNGSRSEPGSKAVKCPYCNGTGMETITTGPFIMRSTCRKCMGSRMHISRPCLECEAKGSTVQRRTITVPVPAGMPSSLFEMSLSSYIKSNAYKYLGVEDGQTVRMQVGQKEVFITFRVERSEYFRREGADVHTDAFITLSQAVLGGSIRIQGIYEDLTLDIPKATASHTRIRINGKGMRKVNAYGYGDHYVHIKIKVPVRLSEKQKALLLAYAELEEDTPGTVNGITYTKDGRRNRNN